jgi:hypothetical protein
MLTEEELKPLREGFRNLVTSIAFLRLSTVEQEADISLRLAEGFISRADWDDIRSRLERNLRVVSLNVGYNVMSNIVAGSEAPFVQQCQKFNRNRNNPDLSGWLLYADTGSISSCTNNSATLLLDYNLFGLQEVNPYFQQEFITQIRNRGNDVGKDFEFYDNNYPDILPNNSLITGYDRNVMGEGILMDLRTYNFAYEDAIGVVQATYFPKRNLLFINVHAPLNIEDIDLPFRLSVAFRKIEENLRQIWPAADVRNLRIIVVGDFNDCGGVLINTSRAGKLTIFGKELQLHVDPAQQGQHLVASRNVERTCCFPNYKCYGDYIFDSLPSRSALSFPKLYYVGHPIDYQREVDLYSDHDPVIMLEFDDFTDRPLQGVIWRTENAGKEHISIAFKSLDRDMLFAIARLYARKQRPDWRISKPSSWQRDGGYPHISLKKEKYPYLRGILGRPVKVILKRLNDWVEPKNRWVVIEVVVQDKLINDNLVCHRECHMSIGQEKLHVRRKR